MALKMKKPIAVNNKMLEKQIEKTFTLRSAQCGEVRKVSWIGRRDAPARVLFLPLGRAIWVVFKAPGENPRPWQLREHARLRAMGQRVVVLDSVDAVDSFFESLHDKNDRVALPDYPKLKF